MKRKIYIARRISENTDPDVLIPIQKNMTVSDIEKQYIEKEVDRGDYIHNGHWILRPAPDDQLVESALPDTMTTADVWRMVYKKLLTSDAVVAIINHKSYGAILEAGYAAGSNKIALYILPEKGLAKELLVDLWLSFQAALQTAPFWDESDIRAVPEFQELGIHSIHDYKNYIQTIIPPFLIK